MNVLEGSKEGSSHVLLFEPHFLKLSKMRSSILAACLFTTVLGQVQYTSTGTAAIAKAKATALTESPTSNIAGKTFNRFVTIWCENTDYSSAAADRKRDPSLYAGGY